MFEEMINVVGSLRRKVNMSPKFHIYFSEDSTTTKPWNYWGPQTLG